MQQQRILGARSLCHSKHYLPKPRNYLSYASPFSFRQMSSAVLDACGTRNIFKGTFTLLYMLLSYMYNYNRGKSALSDIYA